MYGNYQAAVQSVPSHLHVLYKEGEMNTGFWLGNLKEKDIHEYVGVGESIILK